MKHNEDVPTKDIESEEPSRHPWWPKNPNNPWTKKSTTTTPKPKWKNESKFFTK